MMKQMLIVLLTGVLMLSGCAMTGTGRAFDDNGLPTRQYYVGGGFSLNYAAPSPGVVYVIEENAQKLIITQSVEEGEMYTLDIDPTEEEVHMQLKTIGIDPTDMRLALYFVPSEKLPVAD